MGQAIGESMTFAIGVAISPIPIIAIILMLLSKAAGANSRAFTIGWVVGVAGATAIVILASGAIGTDSGTGPSHGTSSVKIVLGVLLLFVGARRWKRRPAPGEQASLPKWLQAIEDITPMKSAALGIGLSALNPKNLIMIVGGGLVIAGAPTSGAGTFVAAVVFVVLAISTVVLPVVLYRILGSRAHRVLESLRVWLQANNATVMAVLIFVIAVVLIGKGVSGF